jgi:hypothetical protein
MNPSGPSMRGLALAAALLASLSSAAPSQAAPADVQLLQSYIGTWTGNGVLTGASSETVRCRLTLSPGNQDKVNYSGRCAMAGNNLSVNGTLAYVEAKRRFEAAMTSNATFTGVAVGKKQGNGVVFNLRERDKDEEGNEVTISAQIALLNGRISVDFNVVFNETGDMIRASVPFSK